MLASRSDISGDATNSMAIEIVSRSDAYCLLVRSDWRCEKVCCACCDGLHAGGLECCGEDARELLLVIAPGASADSRKDASLGIWAARNAANDFAIKRNLYATYKVVSQDVSTQCFVTTMNRVQQEPQLSLTCFATLVRTYSPEEVTQLWE